MTGTSITTGDLLQASTTGDMIEIVITMGLLVIVMRDIMTITETPERGRGSDTTRTGTETIATGRIDTERTGTGMTGMRGPPGTTMSVTEAMTGMEEEEVTTLAAPAGGLPPLGPRPATEDRG